MNLRQAFAFFSLSLVSFLPVHADLSEDFADPYQFDVRPWCFWYWMHGAVTREGITADLEAMAQNGLGGAYLMPIKGIDQNPDLGGTVRQLSPEWYEMVDWAMQECDRLGLKLGMHICDGFALAGGPWITPEESMQKVVMTHVDDSIGTTIGYYGIPAHYLKGETFFDHEYSTRPDSLYNINVRAEGKDVRIDSIGGGFSAKQPCTITYSFDESITVSALELELPARQHQAQRLDVYASGDGVTFEHVKQLTPARAGWQDYDSNTTHSVPITTARYWQFRWDPEGTEPGAEDLDYAKWSPSLKVNRIIFHSAPRVNQWEGKAGRVWRVSTIGDNTLRPWDYIPFKDVRQVSSRHHIDLSDPTVLYFRLASVSTGHDNATGGDAKGLECDKFNREVVRKQLDAWFGSHFTAEVPDSEDHDHEGLARRILKYIHVDSWECGSQNWSPRFAEEFRERRGYSIMPYLPVLVGFPLGNEEDCEQILRDVRLTIAELVNDVFFDEVRRYALLNDCSLSTECVCPTMVSDGMSHFRYADLPMGEFWLNSPTHDKFNDMLDAVSGGHIYGKRIIQAEGFTEVRGVFDEDPAMLKPLLDRNFCLGVNRLFYHVWCHNPNPAKRPGMTLDGIGVFFQPGNTWFNEAAAFTQYVKRCQYMLQQGRPVVDLAVFTGQEVPRRAITPDRLVPMLPGIFGPERVESEQVRLANVGIPMAEQPVKVKHNANLLKPEDWINPLHGYRYDSYNADALMRCQVYGGRISMESLDEAAPAYKALILPLPHKLSPDSLGMLPNVEQRLDELRMKGATIITPDELPWTDATFSRLHISRDVDNLPEGIDFCHRTSDEAEIYFLSNQLDSLVTLQPSFRDTYNRRPELWDPMDGSIRRMEYEIVLQPHGSVFVVFPVSPTPTDSLSSAFAEAGRDVRSLSLDDLSWDVRFHDSNIQMAAPVLFDWSKHMDPAIKYYAGRATYTATLYLEEETFGRLFRDHELPNVFLRLNRVANVATIRVNGIDCGVAWTAPFEANISQALRSGDNIFEIDVVNTWANALRANDEGRLSRPDVWTNARYRRASNELLPAGLLGPVELIMK